MKQLTEEQAIKFYKSKIWDEWDDEKIVRFQLFQKKLCVEFSRFHQALESVLKRPVFTHELGLSFDKIVLEYLGERQPPTLDEIIELIPEEKRMLIQL